MIDFDVGNAMGWAKVYRDLGLTPLPSRSDIKAPEMDSYAKHYGPAPVPEDVYRHWRSRNIQLVTGVKSPARTKLMAVDIDGPEAMQAWNRICDLHEYNWERIACWKVITGSGGTHLYFTLPICATECKSGMIWAYYDTFGEDGSGCWAKHKEIRIVGDRGLIVAPPSIHVDTEEPYRWDAVRSPNRFARPAMAPPWLLAMKRFTGKPRFDQPAALAPRTQHERPRLGNHWGRKTVLDAMGDDKLAVAKSWGLVVESGPNAGGWCKCYVPGREIPGESNPSGSFNARDGVLMDCKDQTVFSLFDIGCLLQRFATWQDCLNTLGEHYLGTKSGNS
jgi:hypothetical protein